jgi:hypothetical protein
MVDQYLERVLGYRCSLSASFKITDVRKVIKYE